MRAVDYGDVWNEIMIGGKVSAYFAAYYICMYKRPQTGQVCATLILAKHWSTKFEDPLHTGQSWYCTICDPTTRYRTSFGMLIEIFKKDKRMYARAPVKPFDVMDVHGMGLEVQLQPGSPEELYEKIPMLGGLMRWLKKQAG